jgi:hypothetical protein
VIESEWKTTADVAVRLRVAVGFASSVDLADLRAGSAGEPPA